MGNKLQTLVFLNDLPWVKISFLFPDLHGIQKTLKGQEIKTANHILTKQTKKQPRHFS